MVIISEIQVSRRLSLKVILLQKPFLHRIMLVKIWVELTYLMDINADLLIKLP